MRAAFEAFEYTASGELQTTQLAFEGDEATGWAVVRQGKPHLELGPGYRLMQSLACGICSTDLARRFLPFPLPQVTGHEVVAVDNEGQRFAVDINASHFAQQLETDCPFCTGGLSNHCPERLVLGIHDLPGGFGPWFLAPVGALRPIPADMPTDNAVLVEPLAAALHGVETIDIREGDSVAVLGPRKLGMLAIAALSAQRRKSGKDFKIIALARRPDLLALAKRLGADCAINVADGCPSTFEIVIDCTGSPAGFDVALAAATREIHLKSTNGQPAGGVEHLTEFVVDELNLANFSQEGLASVQPAAGRNALVVGWMADAEPPSWLRSSTTLLRGDIAKTLRGAPPSGLPKADAIVVDTPARLVEAIRAPGHGEYSPLRPTGTIFYAGPPAPDVPLLDQLQRKQLLLSSSRCGDFSAAIELLASDSSLQNLGAQMITHRFTAAELPAAFAAAASPDCIKAVVSHLE